MTHAFVAVSAVVPSLLLLWYFHRRDLHREPALALLLVFGGGILAVGPVLAVARPIDPWVAAISGPVAYGLASAFLQAAVPEELFKFVVVRFAARRGVFDEPMDGIVYGVTASLGFATFENVVYVTNGGFAVALTRALTAVPSHAFLGAIMGYFVGRAKFEPARRRTLLIWALALPTLLHGLYDWPLLAATRVGGSEAGSRPWVLGLLSLAPALVVGEWIAAVRLTRAQRLAQLRSGGGSEWRHEPTRSERWSSIALAVAGATVASLGGVLMLGGSWIVAVASAEGQPIGQALATTLLAGVTPTLIGGALFAWGVRRLNESSKHAAAASAESAGHRIGR